MRKLFIITIWALSTLAISCDKKPIESEQYKKMVYLVGAQNTTQQLTLNYSDTLVPVFISVATSGSLNIDKDVRVSLSSPARIIEDYNSKFFDEDQFDLFLKPLLSSKYEFPNKENLVIKASDGIYARQTLLINTVDLHPDSVYAIPVAIDKVSDYEVNPNLDELIVTLKLKNGFSGNYAMTGERKNLSTNTISALQKNKVLTATAKNKLRLYVGDNVENLAGLNSETILLDIQPDNSIKITAWGSLSLESGIGHYNVQNKSIELNYIYKLNGVSYQVNEMLTFI